MSRRTVILLRSIGGHRPSYAVAIARAALARGDDARLVVPTGAHQDPSFVAALDALPDLRTEERPPDQIDRPDRLLSRLRPDLTVVPDGDILLPRVAFSTYRNSFRLLIMREYGQSRWGPMRAAKSLAKRALMAFARASGVDVRVLKSAIPYGVSAGHLVFDPVSMVASTSDGEAWRRQHLDDGRYWLGILGVLDPRKNVPLILEAVARLQPGRFGVLLAGKGAAREYLAAAPELRERLQSMHIPVRVIDGVLTDLALDSAVSAVDCVVLAHSNEGPSGIFGKARAAGTAVLAAGAKSLRRDVSAVGEGALWCNLSANDLGRSLAVLSECGRPSPQHMPGFLEFGEVLTS